MFKKQGAPDDGLQKGGVRYLAPPYLLSLYGSTGQTGPAKGEMPEKSGLSKGQNAEKSGLFAVPQTVFHCLRKRLNPILNLWVEVSVWLDIAIKTWPNIAVKSVSKSRVLSLYPC